MREATRLRLASDTRHTSPVLSEGRKHQGGNQSLRNRSIVAGTVAVLMILSALGFAPHWSRALAYHEDGQAATSDDGPYLNAPRGLAPQRRLAATLPSGIVPVLLYHHIDPHPVAISGPVITDRQFEWEMAWLESHGYTAITTADLGGWLAGLYDLPDLPVLITFDDGYASVYDHAYLSLLQHRLRATLFMIGDAVGGTFSKLPFLSWDQLLEMQNAGVFEIQSHSYDGHRYVKGRPALLSWTGTQVQEDTRQFSQLFHDQGISEITAYAYPYGAYNQTVSEALQAEGIQLAFTVHKGYVRRSDSPLALNRFVIYPGTSQCEFIAYMTGRPTCG